MICNKKCNCKECEMLSKEPILFIDDSKHFNEVRIQLEAFKCYKTGNYALNVNKLKSSSINDDWIYASENKSLAKEVKQLIAY